MRHAFRHHQNAFSALLLGMASLALGAAPARADADVPTVIVDADTGEVLHAEEATRPWFPASTTKMMTAYVALREVEKGRISFDTPLVVGPGATRQPPSKIGLKAGQEITLGNALKILMVKSANDVAAVIAEGVGGSVPGFAAMMNAEASRLGMRESHFVNPHGLHQESHVSSARDMAVLARAMLREFPHYRGLWGIGAVQLGNRKFANTNGLIGRYPGAMGMKTGFVCASGFNLVSAAERNGRTLIAVVFGATSGADRTLKAAQLLDQGFGAGGGGGFFRGGDNAGSGRSLHSLSASFESSAPNRRAAICGRGRAPASEEDGGGVLAFSPNTDAPDSIMNPGRAVYATASASGVGARAGGRISLGARAPLEAIEVHLGRVPGSTEVARRPGGTAAPAQAFAEPARRRAGGNPLALTEPMARPAKAARIGQGTGAADRPARAASLHAGKAKAAPVAAGNPGLKAEAQQGPGKKAVGKKGDNKKKTAPKAKAGA